MKETKPQFILLALVHTFIWVFVLLAFINSSTAKINLYYLIPLIYILHIFPLHFINEAKQAMYPYDWKERADEINNSMGIPGKFVKLQKSLDKECFANPISPQGMLLFGAITSAWVLK